MGNPATSATLNGQRATLTDANTNVVSFAYDGFDRLATTSYPLGSSEALTYDADGNVTLRCTRAGLPIAYAYDTLNRLATKTTAAPGTPCTTAPSALTVTYAYDLAGRRTAVSDTSAAIVPVAAASSVQYATTMTYDALNRPTGASWSPAPAAVAPTASSVTFQHAYNAVNQRTGQTVTDSGANVWIDYPTGPAATTGYTANALNQYTAVAAANPTYDANGNTTFDGALTYGYDSENRLTSAANGASTVGSYSFDGRGRRKTKTVGSATTVSITDADNREVLEYDGTTGAILRWYAYGLGPNALLNQMDVAGGTRTTLLPDQLGSIIGKFDSGVGTVGSFAYRSYGKSGSVPGQFGYTGQRFDAESGNYYYRARQYMPAWGRFAQADPIGHAGGMHLYGYVANDPLNALDPEGTFVNFVIGAVIGASVDAAYQYATKGEINLTQLAVAAAAGAVTSGASVFIGSAVATVGGRVIANAAIGAVVNSTQTATVNALTGDTSSVGNAFLLGALGGAGGSLIGDAFSGITSGFAQRAMNATNLDVRLAALDFIRTNPGATDGLQAIFQTTSNSISSAVSDILSEAQIDLSSFLIPKAYGETLSSINSAK